MTTIDRINEDHNTNQAQIAQDVFLFLLGQQIVDKEVYDVRLVVGRLLDADEGNKPMYLTKHQDRGLEWYTAKALEQNFKAL